MVNAGMADTISAEFDRKQAVIDCLCREIDDLKADIHRLRALDSLKTISLTDSPTWQAIGAYAEVKEENARLKAEVERLTAKQTDIDRVQAQSDFYRSKLMNETAYTQNIQLLDQVKHLEAKVERMTNAGDKSIAICDKMREVIGDHHWTLMYDQMRKEWNAATEVQS